MKASYKIYFKDEIRKSSEQIATKKAKLNLERTIGTKASFECDMCGHKASNN